MKAKKSGYLRQDRNQQRDKNWRDENDVGRESKNPGAVFGHDFVFVEKLPQVTVRLKNARPALGLNHLLESRQYPRGQRCEYEHHGGLHEVEENALAHGYVLRQRTAPTERLGEDCNTRPMAMPTPSLRD